MHEYQKLIEASDRHEAFCGRCALHRPCWIARQIAKALAAFRREAA